MVDRNVFDRRLSKLEELLGYLRPLTEMDREVFATDKGLQAQAERWTHLAIECAIDLANHLIADRGWRSPSTNRETFRILAEYDVLSAALSKQMEGWAGLRNILVHLYLDVDHERLFEILSRDLAELEAYAAALARVLSTAENE